MRRAVGLALLVLVLLAGSSVSYGESERLDLSGLQAIVDETDTGIDLARLSALVSGDKEEIDIDALFTWAATKLKAQVDKLIPSLVSLTVSVLVWALTRQLTPRQGGKYAEFACAALSAMILLRLYGAAFRLVAGAVERLMRLTDALVPVLVSMLALSGGTHTASLITPMGALISRLVALVVQKSALSLCSMSAALTAASAMGGLRLGRLGKFVNTVNRWLIKTAVGVYLALMATGGLISGAYDGALLKGARYAADNLLPIIGGEVAGMMDSLAASVTLLRGGAGVTAAAALLAVCFAPMMHCAALSLYCRFLAAAAEPVGEERALKLMDEFADVFGALMATVAAAGTLILILIGAALGMGQRIAG